MNAPQTLWRERALRPLAPHEQPAVVFVDASEEPFALLGWMDCGRTRYARLGREGDSRQFIAAVSRLRVEVQR